MGITAGQKGEDIGLGPRWADVQAGRSEQPVGRPGLHLQPFQSATGQLQKSAPDRRVHGPAIPRLGDGAEKLIVIHHPESDRKGGWMVMRY